MSNTAEGEGDDSDDRPHRTARSEPQHHSEDERREDRDGDDAVRLTVDAEDLGFAALAVRDEPG